MDKLKLHSPDLTAMNIDKIAELFPNCITEAKAEDGSLKRAVDFDLLRQELSGDLVEGPQERYRLDWPGKREALATANAPIAKTLRPCREESVDFDSTKNLYIEGDNLEALKLLQETYLNKVKMIYIDPPYNTGKDFIYRDNYTASRLDYEESSSQRDEQGGRLVANPETVGRFHSNWASMISSRIRLARNLLSDDGFLFISIDDHEAANLRHICDETFGEQNMVAQFIWNTEGHSDNQYDVKVNHEYVLLYSKSSISSIGHVIDPNTREESNLWKGFAENSITKNGSGNPPSEVTLPSGFPCVAQNVTLPSCSPPTQFFEEAKKTGYITRQISQRFEVSYPIRLDNLHVKDGSLRDPCRVFSGWANVDKLKQFIRGGCQPIDEGDGNTLRFYLSPKGVIYYRRDRERARNVVSVLRNMGTTEQMRSELERIEIPFEYPKPKQLIQYLLRLGAEPGGIIVDFFSGSATTAQSIFEAASDEPEMNLRFLLVQLDEKLDPDDAKQKPGYDFCQSNSIPATIAEIGKERIRRTGAKIRDDLQSQLEETQEGSEEHQTLLNRLNNLDIGFRVLKVDSSNMADVYYTPDKVTQDGLDIQVENIKPDRTPEDLLFQVLLDWGVDLALPIEEETIDGKTVFFVDGNALAACFDPGLDEDFVKTLAKREPLRAVFRDASFATDATKINIEQIFKALSPHTDLKAI